MSTARKGQLSEFTWNLGNVPGRSVEPFLPTWYEPFPWVQLSEFQKWSDVNQFALGLFTNTAPLSSELTREINEWKRLPDPEQRVLAALRFVQDEIGNRAIESGVSGYKPDSAVHCLCPADRRLQGQELSFGHDPARTGD